MKKLLFLLLLSGSLFAQTMTDFYQDTLKTSKKVVTVTTRNPANYYTVTLWTTSGTDTIYIKTPDRSRVNYSTKSLRNLTTGTFVSDATKIIVTTTPVEYVIYDPQIFAIKITTTDTGTINTVFTFSAKSSPGWF